MTEQPPVPEINGGDSERRGAHEERQSPPAMPRWVKVFGLVAIAVLLLVAIILLTGIGGDHGPGRHRPSNSGAASIVYASPGSQEVT